MHFMICEMYIISHLGSGDSSVEKYRTCDQMVTEFKSQQKQWVNITTAACKIFWSLCQKCRWQVTAKHTYTPWMSLRIK